MEVKAIRARIYRTGLAVLFAGMFAGCAAADVGNVETADTSVADRSYIGAPCVDALRNPTDAMCDAYEHLMLADGYIMAEDGSFVDPSFYAESGR